MVCDNNKITQALGKKHTEAIPAPFRKNSSVCKTSARSRARAQLKSLRRHYFFKLCISLFALLYIRAAASVLDRRHFNRKSQGPLEAYPTMCKKIINCFLVLPNVIQGRHVHGHSFQDMVIEIRYMVRM